MKKIYLLSGPGKKEGFSKELSQALKVDLKSAKSIAFIASSPMDHDKNLKFVYGSKEAVGIINHLKEIHIFEQVNIIDDLNKNQDVISNSDVVYLLGGNYKTQLDFIMKNGFDKTLKEYNGIILCTSCGAMNIAKKGYYSKDEDLCDSFFYDGIGLIDITIDPHFDIKNQEQVNEAKKMSFSHVIYGLPNDAGIKITNDDVKIIGNIYVFKDGNMKVANKNITKKTKV